MEINDIPTLPLAHALEDHDISSMAKTPLLICVPTFVLLVAGSAGAQSPNLFPGGSQFNPLVPPPLPPLNLPKIQVPVVPKMDVPTPPISQAQPQPSFSDRVGRCLDEGAAAGLGSVDRDAYTRSCVNR